MTAALYLLRNEMILEGIVEVVFPFIGRVLGYIIIDFLGQIVFYSSGYLTLKLVTLGKYPEPFVPPGDGSNQEAYCIITGITAFILVFVSGFLYFAA